MNAMKIFSGVILVQMVPEIDQLGNRTWVVEAVSERTGFTVLQRRWLRKSRAQQFFNEISEAFGGCLPAGVQ